MQGRPHTPKSQMMESKRRSAERRAKALQHRAEVAEEISQKGLIADELAAKLKLRFIYVRAVEPANPYNFLKSQNTTAMEQLVPVARGGLTIAYRNHSKHVEVAYDKCSEQEQFCKSKGRYQAARVFEEGKRVFILPKPKYCNVPSMLHGMFQWCVQSELYL